MRLPVTDRNTLLRELRDEIGRAVPAGRRIIGVDGVDGAGKTVFAEALAEVFAEEGVVVFRASIDGFHRPRLHRHARGRDDPRGFFLDSYDYAVFRRVLIDPFRGEHGTAGAGFQLAAWDLARDVPVTARWVTAPADAVLIVDGIFLHRPELRDIWDWSIWLDVPAPTAYARMAERDGAHPDPDHPSNRRYRDGQRLYLAETDPSALADAVIDNADADHPARVRGGRE